MKKVVWMSFDLGVRGDYEGLYRWLDEREARECGDNLAWFYFEPRKDLPGEIKTSLETSVTIDNRSRIYLIFRAPDKTMKGRFIFGQRKNPPWAGYAPKQGPVHDDVG